jgi:RNA polymerase sigma-70 factor (ECF subfamily)
MVSLTVAADSVERLEAVYRQDGDRLWHALVAFGRDPELASDSVAEAFAGALRAGPAVRDPQAWVWKVAFRIATSELKRRSSIAPSQPESSYLDPEVDSEVLDALAQLPPKQRTAVILFYYVDVSVRDIAHRTGSSQLSVRANLSRARKRIKQLLGDSHV